MSASTTGVAPPASSGAAAPPKRRSLFWTIAAAFLLTALVGAVAQGIVAVAVVRPLERRELRARADLATSRFVAELPALGATPDSARTVELIRRSRTEADLHLPVIYRRADGAVFGDRPEAARRLADAIDHPDSGGADRPRFVVLASRTVPARGGIAGKNQVLVLRAERVERGFPQDAATLLLSLPIALLASLLAALIVVRLLVRRLRTLERFAQRVAADDLSARVDDPRGDEIGRLAQQLNQMAERIGAARERLAEEERQRRQLFADITHELATPLTSIRGYTETLLDPRVQLAEPDRARYLKNTLEESRRLDRLIRDLFDLARLEAGAAPLERERLDWVALTRNVVERFEPRFTAAGLAVRWAEAPAEAWIDADGHRVEQVVENLLNNALRYVPRGGTVTLSMARTAPGGAYKLTIADDGPGATDDPTRLFQRFYRGAGARKQDENGTNGSGLGLAIVREIVERHGGIATARARVPQGLEVAVELPVAD